MNVSANKLARRLAAVLVSLFAVVVLALPAAAAPQVDKTTPVNDYAGILSRDTIAYVTEISSCKAPAAQRSASIRPSTSATPPWKATPTAC